jgi:hypothetical protein
VPDLDAFTKVFEEEIAKKPKEIVLFVLRGKKETKLIRIEPRWDAETKPKTEGPEKKPEPEKKTEPEKKP